MVARIEASSSSEPEPPSPEPGPPPAAKTPLDLIMERFDALEKRQDQLADVVVKLAEKTIPQGQGLVKNNNQGPPPEDRLGTVLQLIQKGMETFSGGDPRDQIYYEVGKKVVDGTMDSAIKKLITAQGREAATHVRLEH